MPRTSAPVPRSCSTAGASVSGLRPVMATAAPRRVIASATARPMPRVAPVTRARRPVRAKGSDMVCGSRAIGGNPAQRPGVVGLALFIGQHYLDPLLRPLHGKARRHPLPFEEDILGGN